MRKIIVSTLVSALGFMLVTGGVSAASITVGGNGAGSLTSVTAHSFTLSSTSQGNLADFLNHVSAKTNTGKNTASFNTGGNTSIVGGGDSSTTLGVNNVANTNTSTSTPSCCPCNQLSDVSVIGNGADSINGVTTSAKCITKVDQTNVANIANYVTTKSNTGGNNASFNTGGDVSVISGSSDSSVTVSNVANSNTSN